MNIQGIGAPQGENPLYSDPDVMGGRIVFRGTRIPIEVLFENLADGLSLEEVLDAYPTLARADAVAVLELAGKALEIQDQ